MSSSESTSLKAATSDNQKTLRMEVEEEKLDFEIEDELQLKVQNDEVLDGEEEETKVSEDAISTHTAYMALYLRCP